MATAPELTPELEARIKEARAQVRYEHGGEKALVLAHDIQMEVLAFKKLVRALGWKRRPRLGTRSPRARRIKSFDQGRAAALPPLRSEALATTSPADIAMLVERQLSAIDRILADLHGAHGTEPERDARTIASVSRTLKELLRMRAQSPSGPDDDNTMPADLDEFRRDLARRIEAFIASEEDRTVADPGDAAEA
jgi:hypothetical protein